MAKRTENLESPALETVEELWDRTKGTDIKSDSVDESLPWDADKANAVNDNFAETELTKPSLPVEDARIGVIIANLFEMHNLIEDIRNTRSNALRMAGCKEIAAIAKVVANLANELGGVPTVKRGRKPKNGN